MATGGLTGRKEFEQLHNFDRRIFSSLYMDMQVFFLFSSIYNNYKTQIQFKLTKLQAFNIQYFYNNFKIT